MRIVLRLLLFALVCLAAAFLPKGYFACAEAAQEAAPSGNMLWTMDLTPGPRTQTFTPLSGSVYDICVFPLEEGVTPVAVQLWQEDKLLQEAGGLRAVMSRRLSAGGSYRLCISGSGRICVEVTRHALSRCFDVPLELDAAGDTYSKAIVRTGDAHWYAVRAGSDAPLALCLTPSERGPALDCLLFDEEGVLMAEATRTAGGACLMDFTAPAGRTLRIRVASPDGGTGLYGLRLIPGSGISPAAVTLFPDAITLQGRRAQALTASISPDGAGGVLIWESSDPQVAQVDPDGTVTGRRPGTAMITAYAAGDVWARCRVDVAPVALEDVSLIAQRVDMNLGDDVALEWRLIPENASDPRVSFVSSDAQIVEADASGVLRAVGEGDADVEIVTRDGGHRDIVHVHVDPAVRRLRALLVGEQNYASTVAQPRPGSANSVAGLRSMLGELSYGGTRFDVRTCLDVSRDGLLKAIEETFAGAGDQDVSLFYITCHAVYTAGMTCFEMYDGSVLTAEELRLALTRVSGEIILMADCCDSGGVLGRASRPEDLIRGIDAVFGRTIGPSLFGGSRFRVLASAAIGQDSYRIGFSGDNESSMATAFARAVCDAGGWSIEQAARGPMRADTNYDGVVTMDELFRYTSRRVMWYLSLAGAGDYAQTVTVSPEGDVRSVFERS